MKLCVVFGPREPVGTAWRRWAQRTAPVWGSSTNAYKRHVAVEERDGGKPLPHRRFLELLCDRQCRPPMKKEASAKKKSLYLTPALMQSEPWRHCNIQHLANVKGRMRCAWCRFKFKVHANKYADSDKLWARYCEGCEAPDTEDHLAKLRCTNCTLSFCSVDCYREFHQLDSVDDDE